MNLIFIFVTLYIKAFFENLPVLPYRKGRLHISLQTYPFQEGKGCTNSPFNSLYDPFGSLCRGQKRRSEPFHSMVGGPSEVYASSRAAVFCAGMNPPCGDRLT